MEGLVILERIVLGCRHQPATVITDFTQVWAPTTRFHGGTPGLRKR